MKPAPYAARPLARVTAAALLTLAAVPAAARAQAQAAAPVDTIISDFEHHPEIRRPVLLNETGMLRRLAQYYPAALWSNGMSSEVRLRFVVRANGRPDSTTLAVVFANDSESVDAARKVFRHLAFRPATVRGRPVDAWLVLPFFFGAIPPRFLAPPRGSDDWTNHPYWGRP
jgi:TonB family protein